MSEEIWKDVPWAIGTYQVSSFGRFRSLDRFVRNNTGRMFRPGKDLKLNKDKGGYLRASLVCVNNYTPLAHRIVALVFIPNPENKPWVNHKDGNKENNLVDNLEWSTISENVTHAYANGLNWQPKGEKSVTSKLKDGDIRQIRGLSEHGFSRVDLGKMFSVTPECIGHIVLRKNWKHID